MEETQKSNERPPEKTAIARKYLACVHVANGKEPCKYLRCDQPDGEDFWMLCDDCYWGEHSFPEDALELPIPEMIILNLPSYEEISTLPSMEVSEAEAVKRGWIPKSRAMQHLLTMSNNTTVGLAVVSTTKLMAARLFYTGLNEDETDFLYDLFTRGYERENFAGTKLGFADLSDEEEATAIEMISRMWQETTEEFERRMEKVTKAWQINDLKKQVKYEIEALGKLLEYASRWEICDNELQIFFSNENLALFKKVQRRNTLPWLCSIANLEIFRSTKARVIAE